MKKKVFRVSAIVFICVVAFTFATKDLILEQFPALSNMLQASFGFKPKNQEAALLAHQTAVVTEANKAIAEAERVLAESDLNHNETENDLNELNTWQLSSGDDTPQPSIPLNEKVKKYSVVRVNPHPENLPSEGEQIVLPLLDGQTIKVNVEVTKTTENGDYIWSGHLAGYSNDYPIVMTYGEKLTFATVTTPEGSYSLEAVNGVGWLYKNPSVAELSKPGGNDSVEIQLH